MSAKDETLRLLLPAELDARLAVLTRTTKTERAPVLARLVDYALRRLDWLARATRRSRRVVVTDVKNYALSPEQEQLALDGLDGGLVDASFAIYDELGEWDETIDDLTDAERPAYDRAQARQASRPQDAAVPEYEVRVRALAAATRSEARVVLARLVACALKEGEAIALATERDEDDLLCDICDYAEFLVERDPAEDDDAAMALYEDLLAAGAYDDKPTLAEEMAEALANTRKPKPS